MLVSTVSGRNQCSFRLTLDSCSRAGMTKSAALKIKKSEKGE
jgi:hypothetical protein